MAQSREINPAVAIAIIVVIVAIVGFFIWRGTGGGTPEPAPGQTIQNPFGGATPGPTPGTVPGR